MRKWLNDQPAALRTWGFAGLAILCVLSLGVWQFWQGDEEVVLIEGRSFRPSELTAIQTALACANIDKYRCRDGKIYVPRSQRNACLQALEKSGSLRSRYDAQLEGLAPSLLDTRQAREQKQREQLQITLAQMIESIRGVAEASVRYSEHVEGGLHRRVDRRALVAVRAENDQPLSVAQEQAIRQSVIASVAGLETNNVTITDLNYPEAWRSPPAQAVPAQLRSSEPAGASDRVAMDDPRAPALAQFERQVKRVLGDMEGLHVSVRHVPQEFIHESHAGNLATTPGFRPAVNIRGQSAIMLHVTAPADNLAKHFKTRGSDDAIAQTAAVNLRTTIQQLSPRPVAVVVTAEKPAEATPGAEPRRPVTTDVAAQLDFSVPQVLWTCPLLLVALGWLWSAWRRDRLAKEFSAEVRQQPEQLATVLERWASDEAADSSQVAT